MRGKCWTTCLKAVTQLWKQNSGHNSSCVLSDGRGYCLKFFYMVISKTFGCANDPQGTYFFILYGCINKIVLLCEAFVNVYLLYLIIYPFTGAPCVVQAPQTSF